MCIGAGVVDSPTDNLANWLDGRLKRLVHVYGAGQVASPTDKLANWLNGRLKRLVHVYRC